MKKQLIYRDDKSDKFWQIEVAINTIIFIVVLECISAPVFAQSWTIEGVDDFSAPANTLLATYDQRYKNARDLGYDVSHLSLDGNGNVQMELHDHGGFSYYNDDTRRDHGQLSQITRLASLSTPGYSHARVRMLVQTESDQGRYYGWEAINNNGMYGLITWYYGVDAIPGKENKDISEFNFSLTDNIILRTTLHYPDATTAIVRAYAGLETATKLTLLDSIIIKDGVGPVPFLNGGRPGMLYYQNGNTERRPLFKAFTDGVSFGNAPPDPITGLNDEASHNNVLLYPNPAKNSVTLETTEKAIRDLNIVNPVGNVIMSIKNVAKGSLLIDLKNISPGIYFLIYYSDNLHCRVVKKLMILR